MTNEKLRRKNFLVVDFEFTQLDQKQKNRPRGFFSEIIEIGAVKIDGNSLEIVGEIKDFVRPIYDLRFTKDILTMCMISEKDFEKAIEFSDMLAKICKLYEPGNTYFAAWGNADYDVLAKGCERHGIENPVLYDDYLDMAEWYKWEMGDSNHTGLQKAVEEQGIDAGMLWHAACDDAKNTGRLLVHLLNDGWDPEDYFNAF